jgi:putative ABC transport system substrate-binding protein
MLASDLIHRQVAVLVTYAPPTLLAAKSQTTIIPIVFLMGGDPVRLGAVASLNRPGGNITGIAVLTVSLVAKRLGLIRELIPKLDRVVFLVNPFNPTVEFQIQAIQEATRIIGLRLRIERASSERELDAAFATLSDIQPSALIVGADSFFNSQRDKIVALAKHHSIPTVYEIRESVEAGGLMSYAPNFRDASRQVGVYVGRVLNGEKPANLPIWQPTTFELVINLKTAKALGLTVPATLLALADEVIE